jgi:hypothetical protein
MDKPCIYAGSYEKQTDDVTSETIEVHYISAGGMLVAMYVVEDGTGSYYYPRSRAKCNSTQSILSRGID